MMPIVSRRLWVPILIACCCVSAIPELAHAQASSAPTRLELELGGDLALGIGHHCQPPSASSDDTVECGSTMFVPGASLAALLRPNEHLALGITAAAGRSQLTGSESAMSLYQVALEGRAQLQPRAAGGFYAAVRVGAAWLAPIDRRNDNGPLVGLSIGHAWSPRTRGFGVALALNGSLAFFGDYDASHLAHYGTLGFVSLSLRLSYGLPL